MINLEKYSPLAISNALMKLTGDNEEMIIEELEHQEKLLGGIHKVENKVSISTEDWNDACAGLGATGYWQGKRSREQW
jgi:hypothetical protein